MNINRVRVTDEMEQECGGFCSNKPEYGQQTFAWPGARGFTLRLGHRCHEQRNEDARQTDNKKIICREVVPIKGMVTSPTASIFCTASPPTIKKSPPT